MLNAEDAVVQSMQRTILTRLLELTAEQARALDAGDMSALNQLSTLRARLVREAAAYLPPRRPWDDAVAPLAEQLQVAAGALQEDLRAAMEAIQRDLLGLAKREQLTQYLEHQIAVPAKRSAWTG